MGSLGFAQEKKDAKGCKDHPLFTRMPNTYIDSCKYNEFAAEAGMIGLFTLTSSR
jgi:hypothetical protein